MRLWSTKARKSQKRGSPSKYTALFPFLLTESARRSHCLKLDFALKKKRKKKEGEAKRRMHSYCNMMSKASKKENNEGFAGI